MAHPFRESLIDVKNKLKSTQFKCTDFDFESSKAELDSKICIKNIGTRFSVSASTRQK